MPGPVRSLAVVLLLPVLWTGKVAAASDVQVIAGPVSAEVIRIVDGDTLLVAARPWPQQIVEVYVRLRGIDAAETRSACAQQRAIAALATTRLSELLMESHTVSLLQITGDKYFGRIVADVVLENGRNPAQELVAEGLAAAYDGGRKRDVTCSR